MVAKNKKTQRKMDLLELPDGEKIKVIEQLRQNLQRSINEARLWKTLLQYEVVTINGQVVFSSDSPLEGLSMQSDVDKV
ncbi:MAG: hypothetical protein QXZ68_01250 [Candidatus Bathyarchaeia archaeon]